MRAAPRRRSPPPRGRPPGFCGRLPPAGPGGRAWSAPPALRAPRRSLSDSKSTRPPPPRGPSPAGAGAGAGAAGGSGGAGEGPPTHTMRSRISRSLAFTFLMIVSRPIPPPFTGAPSVPRQAAEPWVWQKREEGEGLVDQHRQAQARQDQEKVAERVVLLVVRQLHDLVVPHVVDDAEARADEDQLHHRVVKRRGCCWPFAGASFACRSTSGVSRVSCGSPDPNPRQIWVARPLSRASRCASSGLGDEHAAGRRSSGAPGGAGGAMDGRDLAPGFWRLWSSPPLPLLPTPRGPPELGEGRRPRRWNPRRTGGGEATTGRGPPAGPGAGGC